MQQDESQQANFEGEQSNRGGAAPEHRCCQYIKADGKQCRDWAVRSQEFCYRHGVFLHAGRGIDVPLLEDEASIVLVLSETLRALSHGTIALKNASLLLEGCRLAQAMQMERVRAANLERSRRRTHVREDEIGEEEQETEAGSRKQEAGSSEPNRECSARCPEPGAPSSEPCALSPELCQDPCSRCSEPEARCPDRCDPRYDEEMGEVLAALATPSDELMEEEMVAAGVR